MVVNRITTMGGRAGGGAGAGRGAGGGFSGGMRNGLSDSDRADIKMYKATGSDAAEVKDHIARKIAQNKAGAASVSNVKLTDRGNGYYTLSWDRKGYSEGGSIAFSATAKQAKAAANVMKQTGHTGKTMYQLDH